MGLLKLRNNIYPRFKKALGERFAIAWGQKQLEEDAQM
jgi:hypothetical protein